MAVSYSRIGKNIAAERIKARMTQDELAERMGISTSHFSNVERAQRKASLSFLIAVCTELNIPLERLLCGAIGNVALHGDAAPSGDDAQVKQRIMTIVEGCNSRTRKHILDVCIMLTDLENPD